MSAKTNTTKTTSPRLHAHALKYMKRLVREYGPVTAVRAVTQNYPLLQRADVLQLAQAAKVNKNTASWQFQAARSGRIAIVTRGL